MLTATPSHPCFAVAPDECSLPTDEPSTVVLAREPIDAPTDMAIRGFDNVTNSCESIDEQ